MKERLELRLEVEPVVPDTAAVVQSRLRAAIDEMMAAGEFEEMSPGSEPELIYARGLPGLEEIALVVAVLSVLLEIPQAWPHVKPFLQRLASRLKKVSPGEINVEITIGDRRIRVEGLAAGEAFEVLTRDHEIAFEARHEDD